mmetsp:Transcript_15364/g.22253  ORF Transcript_15364/g.22253 Transcript_15364/m.22253 type:complete len:404 (-) Transcript_15364:159-1370(-)
MRKERREFVVSDFLVKIPEDYFWVRNNNLILNGVVHHVIEDSDDDYLRLRGWFVLSSDLDGTVYTSVCEAMRAHDDALVAENRGEVSPSDLNLPDDWDFESPLGALRVRGTKAAVAAAAEGDTATKVSTASIKKEPTSDHADVAASSATTSIKEERYSGNIIATKEEEQSPETPTGVHGPARSTSSVPARRQVSQNDVIDLTLKKTAAKAIGRPKAACSKGSRGVKQYLPGQFSGGKFLARKASNFAVGQTKSPPVEKSRKSSTSTNDSSTQAWKNFEEIMKTQGWNADERRRAFVKLYLSEEGERDDNKIRKRLVSFETEEKVLSQHEIEKVMSTVGDNEALTRETKCYHAFRLERFEQFFITFRSSLGKNESLEMIRRRWSMFGQQEKSMLMYHLQTCQDK